MTILEFADFFPHISGVLESIFSLTIFRIPLIILWVICLGTFCTLKFKFINIRLFKHALYVLIKPYNKKNSNTISNIQAFTTAISGTIGLGTISGVIIAISTGGPGAVLWMIIIGILGMSVKFAEVTLGFKYYLLEKKKNIGGPFQYIKCGLAELGLVKTGKIIAYIYAVIMIIAMSFGGISFQSNQATVLLSNTFHKINSSTIVITLTLLSGLVIMGGITRIANIMTKLSPIMVILYIVVCTAVIISHSDQLLSTLSTMLHGIIEGNSVTGGAIGSFVAGVRRSVFANEAGIGTSPIIHASTNDTEPARVGCIAMLEPFIDTVLVSFITGIVVILTGSYSTINSSNHVIIINNIFSNICPICEYIILPFIIFSFAFSSIITYSYYCEISWKHIFGNSCHVVLCRTLIMCIILISGLSKNIVPISQLGDLLFIFLTIPNGLTIILLSGTINQELKKYLCKN
ncbi:amino acid carrier family protein [Ehrlichia chaffeensis str. Heartland]|uniref:Sodium:alanine symporter family protein n=1 Tax=Ehrlichia chaffeensis (strain ATCC CRL-10679 / Arkansas) TaxID=205920 RepID=Q2GG54_EHRCR|nr:amino acid carrier protein [Ehrlichia chaffeensis]ABD45533.1 sodium:alanine symporter family protein [Ehrlichia chaffeensis str. Arkansas]AHX03838.1 amino acid carrier family protein [Ehrlichia chaffeensis str. Heartland]AHX06424.1 amino acid carrier family protein [Ehrlichia chaffeensis str. Liberty]AHX07800.1 amino acid carrier family protein [Ehrlichia chaffeensis str. Osceola]AHX08757.1 amino acid carrier family protein [Ehrlichia chaffeensis str. Saint Vincent]